MLELVVVLPLVVLPELVLAVVVPDSGVEAPVLVELPVGVELEVVLAVEEPPDGVGLAAADPSELVLVVA